ncbi:hypothetical protein D557_2418 [Bordetella holmesii 70147]|nr:hypothetical protein D557_2418 [Bordetella holmesii 70147]
MLEDTFEHCWFLLCSWEKACGLIARSRLTDGILSTQNDKIVTVIFAIL